MEKRRYCTLIKRTTLKKEVIKRLIPLFLISQALQNWDIKGKGTISGYLIKAHFSVPSTANRHRASDTFWKVTNFPVDIFRVICLHTQHNHAS